MNVKVINDVSDSAFSSLNKIYSENKAHDWGLLSKCICELNKENPDFRVSEEPVLYFDITLNKEGYLFADQVSERIAFVYE